MTDPKTFQLGDLTVNRMGYGAMQLAGPHVFGPPKDRGAALAVLRAAVEAGVNHIDTSDFYGPHVTNEIIREALHPYPQDLVIVTKVGALRGRMPRGTGRRRLRNWSRRCMTICATSGWSGSMSSICA
jgi:aryl-alcohol dehydrogenase-like predicted oxidoreductase